MSPKNRSFPAPVTIAPSIGRVVWYTAHHRDVVHNPAGMLAAIVCGLNADDTINLAVFDKHGHPHARENVILVQPGAALPADQGYAEWMPFQLGQAAQLAARDDAERKQDGDPQAGNTVFIRSPAPQNPAPQNQGSDAKDAASVSPPPPPRDLSGLGVASELAPAPSND